MREERHPLPCASPGTERAVTVLRFGEPGARPKAYLHASLHADELPGMLALHHLVRLLREHTVLGEVVVVPVANEVNLVLADEVVQAVAEGKFRIWSVETVEQAIELFMGTPAGELDSEGRYPADSVYGRAYAQLEEFDRILTERERGA